MKSTDQKQEVAFTRLATNYENHTKQDEEHFADIKARLQNIEKKIDLWSLKVAGIGGGMSLLVTIVVLLLTKVIG